MAVTNKMFTNGVLGFLKGDYKWLTTAGSTFKIALMGTGYTFDQDTQDTWDDVSANEVATSGTYPGSGGSALTTADPTVDTGTNETRADASDISWTGTTITAKGAIIYQATGVASTSKLICYIDFDGSKSSSNGTFSITFDSTGVFKITAAT